MDTLPPELLPALLQSPQCAMATRLTCGRFLCEIPHPRVLFEPKGAGIWESDFWSFRCSLNGYLRVKSVQHSDNYQIDGCDSIDAKQDFGWANAKFIWIFQGRAVHVTFSYGIQYVANPADIYLLQKHLPIGSTTVVDVEVSVPLSAADAKEALLSLSEPVPIKENTTRCMWVSREIADKFTGCEVPSRIYARKLQG